MPELNMPRMGDGMVTGKILSWRKKVGDPVRAGEVIAEIETDKANVEIESSKDGVISQIVVAEGESVPVGAVIAVLDGGAPAAAAGRAAEPAPAQQKPRAQRAAGQSNGATQTEAAGRERVKASPLARRMIAQNGLDAALIPATGPGGRIVERDVASYLASQQPQQNLLRAAQAAPTQQPPEALAHPASVSPAAQPGGGQFTQVQPSRMREAIARRTVASKQAVPHFYVTMKIAMDRALAMLQDLNADSEQGKITVNDLVVKASAIALGRVPQVNASWDESGGIRLYSACHIGIAVGVEEGLMVPVVRDCQAKSLRQISAEARMLIEKARSNRLTPDEYTGGTFSTSNLGMMGVDEFIAIINPPEAAILAIGGIAREPVAANGGELTFRSQMKVTLSADHRLLDGVIAARFLQEVKKALEAPFSLVS